MPNKPEQQKQLSILEVAFSVIAAAFGVLSRKNSERDFTRGNPVVFIAAGLIFTILFVMTIIATVSLVLRD